MCPQLLKKHPDLMPQKWMENGKWIEKSWGVLKIFSWLEFFGSLCHVWYTCQPWTYLWFVETLTASTISFTPPPPCFLGFKTVLSLTENYWQLQTYVCVCVAWMFLKIKQSSSFLITEQNVSYSNVQSHTQTHSAACCDVQGLKNSPFGRKNNCYLS